jgi:hypothetical protein
VAVNQGVISGGKPRGNQWRKPKLDRQYNGQNDKKMNNFISIKNKNKWLPFCVVSTSSVNLNAFGKILLSH